MNNKLSIFLMDMYDERYIVRNINLGFVPEKGDILCIDGTIYKVIHRKVYYDTKENTCGEIVLYVKTYSCNI